MDKFTLFVYCNFLVLWTTTLCSQNINKQNVNIADETLTDYSFLSRYHYTKSNNYIKRLYRIHHWIPMFIGTPCWIKNIWFFSKFVFFYKFQGQQGAFQILIYIKQLLAHIYIYNSVSHRGMTWLSMIFSFYISYYTYQ